MGASVAGWSDRGAGRVRRGSLLGQPGLQPVPPTEAPEQYLSEPPAPPVPLLPLLCRRGAVPAWLPHCNLWRCYSVSVI